MKATEFPYEYVGGGYFRLRGEPRGKPAPVLHGNEVVETVRAWCSERAHAACELAAMEALPRRYGC